MKIAVIGIFTILIVSGIVIAPLALPLVFWFSIHWLGFILSQWPIFLGIVCGLVACWVLIERVKEKDCS